jgi:1-deoxyxylulose-5-phosphate synthase
MKRRKFIKNSIQTAGYLSLAPLPHKIFAAQVKKSASDIRILGNTGIKVSRIAIGTGSNGWGGSSNQTRLMGIKGLAKLMQHAYDRGVTFWDSADQYGTHPHLKEALKSIPREKVVILTKTHASTETEMRNDLDRFRKEIGTDYLDIVLLHAVTDPQWPQHMQGAMNILSKAREEGLVKSHGISCHSIGALNAAAESDWVQVDLVRFNPEGVRMDDSPPLVAEVIKKMKSKGKGIIGMKVFGDGRLTDHVNLCLKYHLDATFIDSTTVGFESIEQFDDVFQRIPLIS